MTIKEYISQKLSAFGNLTDAEFADMAIELDSEYSQGNAEEVGKVLCQFIEERVLAPRVSNVSENGFSISWDFNNLGKYYLWLCKKYGLTPNEDVLSMSGISVIRNVSDIW